MCFLLLQYDIIKIARSVVMKICIKCNSQLPDMYVACPNCGETQLVMSQNNNYNQQPMMQQQYNYYMMQNQPVQKKKCNGGMDLFHYYLH